MPPTIIILPGSLLIHTYDCLYGGGGNFYNPAVVSDKTVEFVFNIAELGINSSGKSLLPGGENLLLIELAEGMDIAIIAFIALIAKVLFAEAMTLNSVVISRTLRALRHAQACLLHIYRV